MFRTDSTIPKLQKVLRLIAQLAELSETPSSLETTIELYMAFQCGVYLATNYPTEINELVNFYKGYAAVGYNRNAEAALEESAMMESLTAILLS